MMAREMEFTQLELQDLLYSMRIGIRAIDEYKNEQKALAALRLNADTLERKMRAAGLL